jgi:hypothetical protein
VKIPEKLLADLVEEASKKMATDPNYSAVMVGGFVQGQSSTAQFMSAHEAEVGGPEAVVNAIFHAALLGEAFKRTNNRSVPELSYEDLNHVSDGDRRAKLEKQQPAVLGYIEANVEHDGMKSLLTLIALAMDWAL